MSAPRMAEDEFDALTRHLFAGTRAAALAELHDEARRARASEAALLAIIQRGIEGLSAGACHTCGTEPGCNIDCPECMWIADAETAITIANAQKGGK